MKGVIMVGGFGIRFRFLIVLFLKFMIFFFGRFVMEYVVKFFKIYGIYEIVIIF